MNVIIRAQVRDSGGEGSQCHTGAGSHGSICKDVFLSAQLRGLLTPHMAFIFMQFQQLN